ncbi:MAG: hypothetical protein DM484_10280 [Candidatus Methylumidiphilus alinenensis]|uniref:Uncharacterized protein n=1 Tax=Candidatus Methylumidiphilus alinenensis TaxID=2202197 RepID=A0A2W4REC3_9GAMM|nr:MAG: hypothetical protein DM484_10280 [Candidatus Methylumidiphilus alinenensis]
MLKTLNKVISNNESTKTEMNCPRKSRTIPPQITLPSWGLAFLLGAPSTSLAFGWDVLNWISPKLIILTRLTINHQGDTYE